MKRQAPWRGRDVLKRSCRTKLSPAAYVLAKIGQSPLPNRHISSRTYDFCRVACSSVREPLQAACRQPTLVVLRPPRIPNLEETEMTRDKVAPSEPIKIGRLTIQYLIEGTGTRGMGVFELTVPPGSSVPPPHSHTLNEECVYVLEGVLRYSVDGIARDLAQGQWMYSPRGSVHHFSNPFGDTTRALIVLTPDIGAQYFRDVGAIVNAGDPLDRTKLIAVMSGYGMIPAPPQ